METGIRQTSFLMNFPLPKPLLIPFRFSEPRSYVAEKIKGGLFLTKLPRLKKHEVADENEGGG